MNAKRADETARQTNRRKLALRSNDVLKRNFFKVVVKSNAGAWAVQTN